MSGYLTLGDYAALLTSPPKRWLVMTTLLTAVAIVALVASSTIHHPLASEQTEPFTMSMAPHPSSSSSSSTSLPPPPKAGKQPPTTSPTRKPTAAPSSSHPTAAPISANKIQYNGGLVLTQPVVYVIWYGNWTSVASQDTVVSTERFLTSLNATPYNTVLSSYYQVNQTTQQRNYISNTVAFGGSTYSTVGLANNSLSKTSIHLVAADAIVSGELPFDPQGIYFVVTSPDVLVVGMCTSFCGWHSVLTVPGESRPTVVAFAALATACPSGCAPPQYFSQSVNGQLTDGLINVMSHELCESTTDPFGNGWELNGEEMADLCEWTDMSGSSVHTTADGHTYNLVLNDNSKFTVQGEWLNVDGNSGGYCALSA